MVPERVRRQIEREIAGMIRGRARVHVVWCRDLPGGVYGLTEWFGGAAREAWILLSETAWARCTSAEREDTIAHEAAHVLAWSEHGRAIAPHGREWRRIFRSLTAAP